MLLLVSPKKKNFIPIEILVLAYIPIVLPKSNLDVELWFYSQHKENIQTHTRTKGIIALFKQPISRS